jgi:hypothetical protein
MDMDSLLGLVLHKTTGIVIVPSLGFHINHNVVYFLDCLNPFTVVAFVPRVPFMVKPSPAFKLDVEPT